MTNVEIYDTSNSELSSDEYSHEEDDDALMEAAVSKQASPGNSTLKTGAADAGAEADTGAGATSSAGAKPKSKPSEKPDDGVLTAQEITEKDNKPEAAAVAVQEPPSTTAEAIRRIRQLQSAPYTQPFVFFKRRSLQWIKEAKQRDKNYGFLIKRKNAKVSRKRYTSYSRSVSYSRSNSRSLSRSRSRSRSRSFDRSLSSGPSPGRSVSQSPELICLDDTENEDSPEKPEEAKAANVTPIKDNKAKIVKPPPAAKPQFEQPENEKSNENGTSSVLDEFLIIAEPKKPSQAGIELDKLTASLELEQAVPDTTLVQQDDQVEEAVEEPMAMDVVLKRRRSVTPPLSNEKRRLVEDEDDPIIEFTPVVTQNSGEATPVLKVQPSELSPRAAVVAPTPNPLQSQPAFKLSSPYTLAPSPGPNAKQTINLAALSQSLNTPTPPAVPMEISYPTDNLPHITKSNIVIALPEQTAPVTVPAYGSPSYASTLQWSSPPQAAHAQVGPQRDVSAQNDPPRAAIPQQSATSAAIQAPFGTQRVLPPQGGTPRPLQPPTRLPLQVNSPRVPAAALQADLPRVPGALQADLPRPSVPQQAATPLRPTPAPQQPPPVQIQQEQPQVPVNDSSFAVPPQPQPRRSETVSTQTTTTQPESRQKPAAPDLKNESANFHYRLKEFYPELDAIFKDKLDSLGPNPLSYIADIDADLKTLDELLARKEDEWNRLNHLRCMKMELRGRIERMERMSIIKKLLPPVVKQSCSTAELYELQQALFGEAMLELPFKSGTVSLEQCLNSVEANQRNIERLRKAMGLKEEKVPTASYNSYEGKQPQNNYRRNSPGLMRDFHDAPEQLYRQERDCDLPPVNKRPRLVREQDRYSHEMTNSAPNLAASSSSSSRNKLRVPGKHQYYNQNSASENFLENESQIKPLYNSSPMVSQRNLTKRQYDELHSTSYRNEDEDEFPRASNTARGLNKSQPQSRRDSTATNGKEKMLCQCCNIYEAIFECTRCQNQWYCSSKCQLDAWNSHSEDCGQ